MKDEVRRFFFEITVDSREVAKIVQSLTYTVTPLPPMLRLVGAPESFVEFHGLCIQIYLNEQVKFTNWREKEEIGKDRGDVCKF